jgi:hypothetical protein
VIRESNRLQIREAISLTIKGMKSELTRSNSHVGIIDPGTITRTLGAEVKQL